MSGSWLRNVPFGTDAARPGAPRLICFPHAGGGANTYWPLAAELAPDVEVIAVQYPGRQDRLDQPALTDLRALADRIAGEQAVLGGERPAFLGHSMGAVVAYEVAQRLGPAAPALLIVSGCRAPSRHRPGAAHLLDDDELVQHMKSLGGTSAELLDHPEMRALTLPAVRADYRASAEYRHRSSPPLNCPVIALAGDQDPLTTAEDVRAWENHTTGGFQLRTFPGGHFFVRSCLPEVAATISSALAKDRHASLQHRGEDTAGAASENPCAVVT